MDIKKVVSTLQKNHDAVCIVDNFSTAQQLKQAFHHTQQLPQIVVLSQLLLAFEQQQDKAIEHCMRIAALGILPANNHFKYHLIFKIYHHLNQVSLLNKKDILQKRWVLAEQLAQLFIDIDNHCVLNNMTDNPFQGCQEGFELNLASTMWKILVEEGIMPNKQKRLQQLLLALTHHPIAVGIYSDTIGVVEESFFKNLSAQTLCVVDSNQLQAVEQEAIICQEGRGETLTDAAQKGLQVITQFLHTRDDNQKMGIVIYDRILARRLRAMAENDGILIKDTLGWRAETLAYGSAILLYIKMIIEPFEPSRLSLCLQPPFFAKNNTLASAEKEWRYYLANSLTIPTNYDELIRIQWRAPLLAEKADYFYKNHQNCPSNATPEQWGEWLFSTSLPMLSAWKNDQLAEKLRRHLLSSVKGLSGTISAFDFYLYLAHYLSKEYLIDDSIDSPIVFVTPHNRQQFHSIMLLGCVDDSKNNASFKWLSESERETLGLPLLQDDIKDKQRNVEHYLTAFSHLSAIWLEKNTQGEKNTIHPLWEKKSETAKIESRYHLLPTINETSKLPAAPLMTSARGQVDYLPPKLSLSSATDLMVCPYKFYVNQYLALSTLEKSSPSTLSAMLLGKLLHKVLEQFIRELDDNTDTATLQLLWKEIVKKTLVGNHPALNLYINYWQANGQALIEWEINRRKNNIQTQETEFSITMPWQAHRSQTTLKARIDRIDYDKTTEQYSIVDYKSSLQLSQAALINGENPQLSIYAFLLAHLQRWHCEKKLFITPFKEPIEIPDRSHSKRVVVNLRRVLYSIEAGHDMPANGIKENCQMCSSIGICRKKQWQ